MSKVIVVLNLLFLAAVQAEDDYKLLGYPVMQDCPESKAAAPMLKVTVRDELIIFPRWANWTEEHKLDPLSNYTWGYKIMKVIVKDGKDAERQIDSSEWVSRKGKYFTIPPYGVTPGYYRVYVSAKLINPEDRLRPPDRNVCHLVYSGLPPIILISGGRQRAVPPNTEIELSAKDSFDPNEKIRTTETFQQYTWTCTQKKTPTFCKSNPVSTEDSFKIPLKYVELDDTFELSLSILTVYNSRATAQQTIDVLENHAQIRITCVKNCRPAAEFANFHYLTFLEASCEGSCRGLKDEHYEWTVQSFPKQDPNFNFDYEKTQFGRRSPKFVVLKDAMKPGEYQFRVNLTEAAPRRGTATAVVTFPSPPKVTSCQLWPPKGQSMVTFFKIYCQQKGVQRNLYEIMVKDKKDPSKQTIVVEQYFPHVFELRFQLPPSESHTFEARVSFHGGPATAVKIKGTVTKSSVTVDGFKKFYDKLPTLLTSLDGNNKEEGIRRFHALVDQLVITVTDDKETQDFIQDLKYTVATDILRTHVTSHYEVDRIAEAITNLLSLNEAPQSDPLLAKIGSVICKKMVHRHLTLIREEKFPQNCAEKAAKVSTTLTRCLETNTNPNLEAIAPVGLDLTTEAPTIAEVIATESYSNYVDYDEEYYQNLEYLKESTFNIISATSVSAKVVAMTSAVGEKFVEIFGNRSATTVAKDKGKVLAGCEVRSQGVLLVPSQDFVGDEHDYDILMSTWTRDILWWNRGKIRVSTDVVSVEFWHSTCKQRVGEFKEPAQLSFAIKEDQTSGRWIEDEFKVPDGFSSLTGEDLSRAVRVRRVSLPRGRTLRVLFSNLTGTIRVVITNFKFPTEEDFENGTTVSGDDSAFLSFLNAEDYDVWSYIGVLASRNSFHSVNYHLSTTTSCCIRWAEANNVWEQSCKSGVLTNQSTIHCHCRRFSVLAGYLEDVESIAQEVVKAEMVLRLESTVVIFVTVAVTLGIYCCVLVWVKSKKKVLHQSEVYYLGDNNGQHRFAYLLSMKTGGGRHSGTTSNVTIRLIGDKNSSAPHVLNYPDPKLRLLQRFNQDYFLLATKHYLGQIQKIELWFDCLGPSPDWFCKDITVHDMQEYHKWYFDVKTRLGVIKGESHVELSPTNSSSNRVHCDWRYHTWYLCHGEENLRATVVLSKILSMSVLVLAALGVPSMCLDDCFDQEFEIGIVTLEISAITALASFVLHFILLWGFRCSKGKSSWITWIIRILLITVIVSCASTLIILGFWVPFHKSLIWLTMNAFGLCFILIVYENIFICFQSIFCKMKYNIELQFQQIYKAVEVQRQSLHKTFGDVLLRPYFKHLYEPLQSTRIKEKEVIVAHRRGVIAELEDLVMFGIYVIILYVVILANKDNLIVRGKANLEDILEGKHTKTLDFYDTGSLQSLYDYINSTLISAMQPSRWYGKYVISEPAMMIDMNNKFIGVARMRQQRIKSNVCTIAENMIFVQNSCVPEFSVLYLQTEPFGYDRHSLAYFHLDRLREIWSYSGVAKTGSLGTVGEFATYGGGGYLAYLGRTIYNSFANFRKIVEKSWIDQKSRSVFIEFLAYNANYNAFSAVTLLFEQSATGYTFKHVEVFTVRMLFVENTLAQMSIIFSFLFIVWVGMLVLRQSIGVIKKIRSFYKEVWFLVDAFIIAMSLTCISLFIYRMSMIKKYLDKLETMKHNEFLNYFYLFYLEIFLTVFAAVLVCVATIRLWKFLRFGIVFRILERTLSRAAIPLASVTFGFALIVTDFAMVVVMLYGTEFEKVNTIIRTVRLLTTMFLRASEMGLSNFTIHKSAYFYFVLYSLVLKFTFVVLVAIIVTCYSEAQMEFSQEPDAYNIKHYVQERMRYIPRFIKYKYLRQRGGQEERSKVVPKPDKFLYVNTLSISTGRLQTMACLTRCVVRNLKSVDILRRYDAKLVLSLCRKFLGKQQSEEVEIFFKGRVQGKRLVLVDEKKIETVAKAASKLVGKKKRSEVEAPMSANTFGQPNRLISQNLNCLGRCNLSLKLIMHKINSVEARFAKINKIN